jgi:hypothetical protein
VIHKELLEAILARLEVIEAKLTYLHDYVQQKEGEPSCPIPRRNTPMEVIGAVEQYVCQLNKRKEDADESRSE